MITLQPTTPVAGKFITEFSHTFWQMAIGGKKQIAFMDTPHLFNCFRMLYDSAATENGWPLMRVGGMKGRYDFQATPKIMANFANEIVLRGDLPDYLLGTFNTMLEFCMGRRLKIE